MCLDFPGLKSLSTMDAKRVARATRHHDIQLAVAHWITVAAVQQASSPYELVLQRTKNVLERRGSVVAPEAGPEIGTHLRSRGDVERYAKSLPLAFMEKHVQRQPSPTPHSGSGILVYCT